MRKYTIVFKGGLTSLNKTLTHRHRVFLYDKTGFIFYDSSIEEIPYILVNEGFENDKDIPTDAIFIDISDKIIDEYINNKFKE